MSIISWNVRGLNSPESKLDFSNLLQTFKPSVVGILEYKLTESNINMFHGRLLNN